MNKTFRQFFCLLLLCCSACFSSDAGGPVPRQAPYTKFYLLSGEQVPLAAYRGKVVAVVFWGSWCGGSKRALRGLNEIATDVSPERFAVVAASLDRESDEKELFEYIEKAELDHIQYAFSGNEALDEAYLTFKAEDVPHIFLVDESGTIVLKARSAGDVEDYLETRGIL